MKKILIIILMLLAVGCSKTNASFEVETYLNKFKNHDKEVIASLDELLTLESITLEQKDLYRLIMKKQYTDLEYEVKEEHYNGDQADVEVLIKVYDYTESKKRAYQKMKDNPDIMNSNEKKMNEQLKEMEKETKRVPYTLVFHLRYENEQWILETPNTEILEKIHGIYDYEED